MKHSKVFQKWPPIAIIWLPFLSFLLFHFPPTTFPSTYLELFLLSLLWKNYWRKKKKKEGFSLLAGCDERCNQSHVPRGRWGEGGAPRTGLAIEKPGFSVLTDLVLGSVHSCWLQLSWQVTLPETLIQAEETRENEQGKKRKKISSISNCRGPSSTMKETLQPNSLCFMAFSITWH